MILYIISQLFSLDSHLQAVMVRPCGNVRAISMQKIGYYKFVSALNKKIIVKNPVRLSFTFDRKLRKK